MNYPIHIADTRQLIQIQTHRCDDKTRNNK